MSWKTAIQEVKYISPEGNEFTWQYEGVSIEVDKKTTEFQFAERNGVYVQDKGVAGRKFPFTLFFVGDDYNQTADEFMLALEEQGIGKLEHPLYGDRNVIPTGKITRRDDLITEANQAIFNVTFSETIKDIFFPSNEVDAISNISDNLDNLQETQAKKFSLDILADSVGQKINLSTRMAKQANILDKKMKEFIRFSTAIKTSFDTAMASYENSIDSVFDNAETISYQGIELIRLPSRIESKMKLKTQIYSDMFIEILDDFEDAISNNNFFETNKNMIGYNAALCEGVLYSTFNTRNEAIETAEDILSMYDDIKDFQDQYLDSLGIIDTGEDYESLSRLIGYIAGYLISISFNLPSQKSVILGEATNIIPLCVELYGSLDYLDYFIDTNNFNCDELEILPIEREVIYYE